MPNGEHYLETTPLHYNALTMDHLSLAKQLKEFDVALATMKDAMSCDSMEQHNEALTQFEDALLGVTALFGTNRAGRRAKESFFKSLRKSLKGQLDPDHPHLAKHLAFRERMRTLLSS